MRAAPQARRARPGLWVRTAPLAPLARRVTPARLVRRVLLVRTV
ncbi:hypothetical protein [Streptomyces sp. NBC_00237]|nr:hypothetical protein [Streptomyces sp. NBC_00237]